MRTLIEILIFLTIFISYAFLHIHLKKVNKIQTFHSTLLVLVALFNFVIYTSMFLCTGWSASDGEVDSCMMPGVENLAELSYFFSYISSFMIFLPFIIPAIIAWRRTKRYLTAWKEERSHAGVVSKETKLNTVLSCLSAFMLIVIPLLYLFLGSRGYTFDKIFS